jgi:type IV pilus assembly protein PilC
MKLFSYRVLLPNGKRVEQSYQANSKKEVSLMIRAKGWRILSIKEIKQGPTLFRSGVSTLDKANFCRYLSVMIKSGLAIAEAVQIISSEAESKRMKEILTDLTFDLEHGETISSSLRRHEDVFDKTFLALVSAGEESGSLEKTFAYLADQQYAVHRLNKKISGAMMYPAVILVAMFGVGILMVTFVLPRLGQVFLKMKIPLPTPTRLLLEFGNFMGENTWQVFTALVVLIVAVITLFKYHATRRKLMSWVANAPLVHKLFEKIDLARFSRTLATLLQSGVPITDSLKISSDVFTQRKMQEIAKKFPEEVSQGRSIAEMLTTGKKKTFPALMVQTIKTGEKTGSLSENLFELADFYEAELEDALKEFTTILEPVIMLVIGVGVGTMVVMIIAPIYSVLGNLQGSAGGPPGT